MKVRDWIGSIGKKKAQPQKIQVFQFNDGSEITSRELDRMEDEDVANLGLGWDDKRGYFILPEEPRQPQHSSYTDRDEIADEDEEFKLPPLERAPTLSSRIRGWWVKGAASILAVVIWIVIGIGDAMFFAGFQVLTLGAPWQVKLAWLGGFAYSFGTIALIFVAANRYERKQKEAFRWTLAFAILASCGSLLFQYLYIYTALTVATVDIDTITKALLVLPVDIHFIAFIRAAFPILMEFAIVFLVTDKEYSVQETIRKQREQLEAEEEMAFFNLYREWQKASNLGFKRMTEAMLTGQQVLIDKPTPQIVIRDVQHEVPQSLPQPPKPVHRESTLEEKIASSQQQTQQKIDEVLHTVAQPSETPAFQKQPVEARPLVLSTAKQPSQKLGVATMELVGKERAANPQISAEQIARKNGLEVSTVKTAIMQLTIDGQLVATSPNGNVAKIEYDVPATEEEGSESESPL
jgi:hypothetical protein